jgi:hypothetical protein
MRAQSEMLRGVGGYSIGLYGGGGERPGRGRGFREGQTGPWPLRPLSVYELQTHTSLHGATTHKTAIFIITSLSLTHIHVQSKLQFAIQRSC